MSRIRHIGAVAVCALLMVPAAAVAGPGLPTGAEQVDLEETFGRQALDTPFVLDLATAGRDGAVFAATSSLLGRDLGAHVVKLNPELEPATEFSGDGLLGPRALGASGSSQSSAATALLSLPGGKLLVAGVTGYRRSDPRQLFLTRRLADGSPDPSFGAGGVVYPDPTGAREGTLRNGLALRPDGTILLAFDRRDPDALGVLALEPDGTPDPSFGDGGVRMIPRLLLEPDLLREDLPQYIATEYSAYDVATDSTGRVALVGSERVRGRGIYRHRGVLVRLSRTGRIIRKPHGFTLGYPPPCPQRQWTSPSTAVEYDRSDRVVIAGGGGCQRDQGPDLAYFSFDRVLPNGRHDRDFGDRGRALLRVRPGYLQTGAADVALGRKGRIVAAGPYGAQTPAGYLGATAVAAVTDRGRPDRAFGNRRGLVPLPPRENDGQAVAVDSRGRVLAAGGGLITRLPAPGR